MLSELTTAEIAILLGGTLLGAVLTVALTHRRTDRSHALAGLAHGDAVSFLYHGTELVDATEPAVIAGHQTAGPEAASWGSLRRSLERRFGDLPATPEDALATNGDQTATFPALDPGDNGRLIFSRNSEVVRISIVDHAPGALDRQLGEDIFRELRFLRSAIADAPNPIWSVDPEGRIVWHNRAYSKMAEQHGENHDGGGLFPVAAPEAQDTPVRVALESMGERASEWYEVTMRPTRDGFVGYASNVDAVVRAEQAQRNFVQTLTKTFAHLSTGLAIFDRHQRLALFNPALIDLTGIPVEFLTSKPGLAAFFDYLREHQIMPEPKNYPDWRDRISAVIAAARDGRYCKTWNLPSGLTYRVTGKPHPDGAVAFLFEDISAEVSLTRRFRAELETSQAVLDKQEKALAVFSQMGILTFSNDAFREMWRFDPDSSFAETTLGDVLKIWQSECAPNPAWDGLQRFVTSFGERVPRKACVVHESHGALDFSADPLSGGATLVSFCAAAPQDHALGRALPQPG